MCGNYDCILTMTERISKAITFIAGRIAEGGEHWARLLLDRLTLLEYTRESCIKSPTTPKTLRISAHKTGLF